MTKSEILEEIHKENAEVEILQALQQWLLNDRDCWISRARECGATVKAVKNIAEKTENAKTALEGIRNLCSEE